MRLIAIAVTTIVAMTSSFAQTAGQSTPPASTPAPTVPSMTKTEDSLGGKTPPKEERGGKEQAPDGTETGWSGQWKTPADSKSQSSRNEAEGKAIKKPGERN